MKNVRVETVKQCKNYIEKKIIIDKTLELSDKKGLGTLKNIEEAIAICRSLFDEGYSLVDCWVHKNRDFEFILKKFY